MKSLRKFADEVRVQMEAMQAEAQGRERPTSLYSAGSVGGDGARAIRQRAADPADPSQRPREFPVEPMPTDVETPRARPAASRTRPRPAPVSSRAALLTALRSPASLRTAIVIREVLDPPVALRRDRDS